MLKGSSKEGIQSLTINQKGLFLLRRLVPLLVSGLLLYWYSRRVDWQGFHQALLNANLFLFIPARFFPLLIYLLIDSYLLKRLLDWFHQPVSFSEVIAPRASLYLLGLVNVQISNGGMFLYLMRRARVKAEKLAGLVVFRFAWSVWSINFGLTLALFAIFLLDYKFYSPLSLNLIIVGIVVIWASLFLCLGLVYYYRHFRPEAKHRPLWSIFIQAKPRQYLEIALWTLVLAGNGVINNFLCALSFGVKIPIQELVVLLPVAEMISALPIAFAGLGITTFAWETLFKSYGSTEEFLSFTIALPVLTYLSRALFGLIALPWATRMLQEVLTRKKEQASLIP